MSTDAISWAKRVTVGSATKKLVLLLLCDYADEAWSCFPGQQKLAAAAELGERTVRRALAELEADGWISREARRRTDGSRTSDRFYISGQTTPRPADHQPATAAGWAPDQPANDDRTNRPMTTEQPAAVAGHEPSVEPSDEPPGSPLPPAGQLLLVDPAPVRREEPLTLVGFDAFWRVYPYKVGKPSARRAWDKAIRRANPADIIAGAIRYAEDPNRKPDFTKHPGPWLNDNRWEAPPLPGPSRPANAGGRMGAGLGLLRERAAGGQQALGSGAAHRALGSGQ